MTACHAVSIKLDRSASGTYMHGAACVTVVDKRARKTAVSTQEARTKAKASSDQVQHAQDDEGGALLVLICQRAWAQDDVSGVRSHLQV